MKKEIGLWIDHREAIIVIFTDNKEEIKHVVSNVEKHVRYSGGAHSKSVEGLKDATSEDRRDRRFVNELNGFYGEVIAFMRDADSIQIFGPGEAKGGLEKRMELEGLKAQVVEATDKLTERQIAAKVRLKV